MKSASYLAEVDSHSAAYVDEIDSHSAAPKFDPIRTAVWLSIFIAVPISWVLIGWVVF